MNKCSKWYFSLPNAPDFPNPFGPMEHEYFSECVVQRGLIRRKLMGCSDDYSSGFHSTCKVSALKLNTPTANNNRQ